DSGIRRAPSALTEDVSAARELHGVPHDEKESSEAESAGDSELVLHPLCLGFAQCAPPLVRAFKDFHAQERDVVMTGWNGELRHGGPQPGKGEVGIDGAPLRRVPSF